MRTLIATVLTTLALWGTAAAQEPARLMLEAGVSGGYNACPGHYVGVEGRIAGPASVYGMVENYRCVEIAGSASRVGLSVRLGRADWLIRPAVRGGIEYDGDEVMHNVGASLTLGRRYGARIIVNRGPIPSGGSIVILHLGGYVSF